MSLKDLPPTGGWLFFPTVSGDGFTMDLPHFHTFSWRLSDSHWMPPTEVYEDAFAMTWKPPLPWLMSIRSSERERVLVAEVFSFAHGYNIRPCLA